ncbi:glycosyltransferase [Calothrix sp. NIES-3974]|uniref:glycosyltransferase n=1 Tax=Calothrix sp. NIES-3974 TaxID=2005462 RepID=UPI000BBCE6A6|nr:glycosyltransferase [Calothrix sp. NIES-3974]
MNKTAISVVICTYNPRRDYLERVLQALKHQTLSQEKWELLLVDNASKHPLEAEISLSWHTQARCIREEKLGLTWARLRGIKEAVSEIIIFVDDDNVLDSDYLEITLEIAARWPMLGAWGGQIRAEFEQDPPEWTKPYWPLLAIREFNVDKWSNLPHQNEAIPCGAGFCVRRIIAEKYAQIIKTDPRRGNMDRKGKMLTSCGDSDLAFTAYDINMGTGLFTSLKLTHLIPSSRLEEEYLLRLISGLNYSGTILEFLRGKNPAPPNLKQIILHKYIRWKMDGRSRKFFDAAQEGINLALKEIKTNWSAKA